MKRNDIKTQSLQMTVYDYDRIGSGEYVGEVRMTIITIIIIIIIIEKLLLIAVADSNQPFKHLFLYLA